MKATCAIFEKPPQVAEFSVEVKEGLFLLEYEYFREPHVKVKREVTPEELYQALIRIPPMST